MWNITDIIRAIALLITVVVIAVGGWYVMNLKADLAVSRENVDRLAEGIQKQQALIDQMRTDVVRVQKANRDLSALSERQRAEIESLIRRFSQDAQGRHRDLGQLATQRPDAIQRLMNSASRDAVRCLEIATGAPRTEAELNAKNASEINKECPSLANPNYRGLLP